MKITHLFPIVKMYSVSTDDKKFKYKIIKRILFVRKKKGFKNEVNEIKKNIEDILDDVMVFFYNVDENKLNDTLDFIMLIGDLVKNNKEDNVSNCSESDMFMNTKIATIWLLLGLGFQSGIILYILRHTCPCIA